MKLSRNYIQTFVFILVYLFAIYFWSQPYQERKLPYGEFDAISHFEVADYMSYNDKSYVYLPKYIDLRYGHDNDFKPHTLWYAPTFHSSLAVMETIGGERVLPVYLMNTILATFIIITTYFVINALFGFLPAILSSLLIIFSPRDFMPYLWGQWPERFGYAFIPVILYCFYMYFTSYSKESNKPIYLYLASLFLGIQILVHPLSFFHSAFSLVLLYIFLAVKQKKLALNWKHISIAAGIFLVLFLMFPYQTFNVFSQVGRSTEETTSNFEFSRLFQWSLDPKDYEGSVPENYFSFKDMNGLWTLPFLLLGILFLVLRREDKDLLLMAWLVGLYLVLHRDIIGKAEFLHRSLSATAHIFAPLTAIGAIYLASIIKLPSNFNKYLKYGIAVVFVCLALSINMASASKTLNKEIYDPYANSGFFTTLSSEQYDAADWILKNVPSGYNVSVLGIPHQEQLVSATAKKIRWSAAVSQHPSFFYYLLDEDGKEYTLKQSYLMLDYTMLGPLNDVETYNSMQSLETTTLANHSLVYNKDNIRVYKP
jgi:hypothetical protein